ncbi:c-type cytochrome [Ideonella sp. YS5]|uniref:c-type cytochrome n=1 Tax=Ideonella sp. YS5 TaxID=3453714 RepID=UPI003EEA0030
MRATRYRQWWLKGALATIMVAAALAAAVVWLNVAGEAVAETGVGAAPASAEAIARGAYLARAGNCMGCHTGAAGQAFAGGRGIETPFGVVYAPNITSDARTGIGAWSSGEFWRAMHHGRSKSGRLLYPAFPYPSFTNVTREDSDALYAYLRSTKPIERPNREHELRLPYNTQAALAVWRALYFRPGQTAAVPERSAGWNRGRYLVEGLGHCVACHSGRNFLGGTSLKSEFAGGLMPDATWYAPSLATPHEAGVQGWPRAEVVRLLKTGVSEHASVTGPMAEVVFSSTQYLTDQDLDAMAQFLASLPVKPPEPATRRRTDADAMARGKKVYVADCAACHGDHGEGVANIYPALAGNRAVTLGSHVNLLQVIRHGGFAPTTAGNPEPFGMPPFGQDLSNEELADVLTYIRGSWGNAAPPVSRVQVSSGE